MEADNGVKVVYSHAEFLESVPENGNWRLILEACWHVRT